MASLNASNSPVPASAFPRRIKWGFMEAAFPIEQNHFLFQFGGTAHFIPRRFKDRRRVVGGGGCGGSGGGGREEGEGTPLGGRGPSQFRSDLHGGKANSPERVCS